MRVTAKAAVVPVDFAWFDSPDVDYPDEQFERIHARVRVDALG